jgi:hypothetical protein
MRSSVRSRLAPPSFQLLRSDSKPQSVPFCSNKQFHNFRLAGKLPQVSSGSAFVSGISSRCWWTPSSFRGANLRDDLGVRPGESARGESRYVSRSGFRYVGKCIVPSADVGIVLSSFRAPLRECFLNLGRKKSGRGINGWGWVNLGDFAAEDRLPPTRENPRNEIPKC